MNTAVTKFPPVVYPILLLRGLRAQAKPMDRPFAGRENRTLLCLQTLPIAAFALTYQKTASFPSTSPWAA